MGIGSNMGPRVGPSITGQITQQQNQVQSQDLQQPKTKGLAGKGALEVGFERGSGKVASDVAKQALEQRNPIIDADESFVDFDPHIAKNASKSSLSTALALEGFQSAKSDAGNDVAGAASFILNGKFKPTEEGLAKLENLAGSATTQAPSEEQVSALRSGLSKSLGLNLSDKAQYGELSLLAGVAASGGNIQGMIGPEGEIDASKLMNGVASVVRNGGKAVTTAADMAGGIDAHKSRLSTMIPNR